MDHEIEAVYKSWIEQAERYWRSWEQNPAVSEQIYWKDVVPYKHMLRIFYVQNDRPVCLGRVDCLTIPRTKCSAGKHETCDKHSSSCFVCKAEKKQRVAPGEKQ